MRDYPLDYKVLHQYAKSLPYGIGTKSSVLLANLDELKNKLNFPAITNDVGALLGLQLKALGVKKIFEFGSGYGHSLFWYTDLATLEKVVLTEKRDDLRVYFDQLSWPERIKNMTEYFCGDAFARLQADNEIYDFILMDGVKASYLDFLKLAKTRVRIGGIIAIDNSFWRGSFLDPNYSQKSSAQAIGELHQYVAAQLPDFECVFVPFEDGLSLLYRKS